ncbi:MAG: T9SS type A sorting domain-containing protein [Bacteroidales bacterium]|jgi:hypothetical protein
MKKLIPFIAFISIISFANAQWQQTNLDSGDVYNLTINGSNIFAGTDNGGALLSSNGFSSWTGVNNGLPTNFFVYSFAIKRGDTIFAGTQGGGVYLSTNYGLHWAVVDSGSTSNYINAIAINGNNIFAGTNLYGIYLSSNNGGSWTAVNTGLPLHADVNSLVIKGSNIFAGVWGAGVFLSTNNGGLWTAVDSGLTNLDVDALSISGNNIFAGTYGGGVYLSTDNGAHWIAKDTGLTFNDLDINTLATKGDTIFAGTYGGVFFSLNKGSKWIDWNPTLTDSASVFTSTIFKDTIFVGTGGGIWKRALSQMIDHTGIEEINNVDNNIVVYPNPANNYLTIDWGNSPSTNCDLQVFDIIGNNVLDKHSINKKTKIDISALPVGIYVVQLKTEKGLEIQKFVKE